MKTIKIKTKEGWVPLYETYLKSCMRKENNLSDVQDISQSLENLGLSGDSVESHSHDSRYLPMLQKLEDKIKTDITDINNKVFVKDVAEKNGTVTVTNSLGKSNKIALVKTVNNKEPSVYTGNVDIDVSGKVKSVNGIGPDIAGNISISGVPVGTILSYAGSAAPEGFLICNGAEVRRRNYSKLFKAIGITYGSGDGSTTFNLPNLVDNRFVEYSTNIGYKKDAGLPDIEGTTATSNDFYYYPDIFRGAFHFNGLREDARCANDRDGSSVTSIKFNASKSNPIYGSSDTVQPKALTLNAIIKY